MDTWLPADFEHPAFVALDGDAHLRPIQPADVNIDMIAVMGNQAMLWEIYGEAWGWPPAGMTREQDEEDLARHAREMVEHESFNYAVLSPDESALYGCVYIDPAEDAPNAAEVSWWVIPSAPASVRRDLDAFVPGWLASSWPFADVRYPFNEV